MTLEFLVVSKILKFHSIWTVLIIKRDVCNSDSWIVYRVISSFLSGMDAQRRVLISSGSISCFRSRTRFMELAVPWLASTVCYVARGSDGAITPSPYNYRLSNVYFSILMLSWAGINYYIVTGANSRRTDLWRGPAETLHLNH